MVVVLRIEIRVQINKDHSNTKQKIIEHFDFEIKRVLIILEKKIYVYINEFLCRWAGQSTDKSLQGPRRVRERRIVRGSRILGETTIRRLLTGFEQRHSCKFFNDRWLWQSVTNQHFRFVFTENCFYSVTRVQLDSIHYALV